jgi:hypothetical protein
MPERFGPYLKVLEGLKLGFDFLEDEVDRKSYILKNSKLTSEEAITLILWYYEQCKVDVTRKLVHQYLNKTLHSDTIDRTISDLLRRSCIRVKESKEGPHHENDIFAIHH